MEAVGTMVKALPDTIDTLAQLEEVLTRPHGELVDLLGELDGDVMIVGAGGKIGPSLARTAKRAVAASGASKTIFAVDLVPLEELAAEGIETIQCDMLDQAQVERLPKVKNIVYMIGRKFGSTGSESLTWAINCVAAYHAARAFQGSRIAAFSTGCVYPVMHIRSGGATEETPPAPIGEYAQSCLARERMFDFFADKGTEEVAHVRLNYAVECRYGVLVDIAVKVLNEQPVDVTTGYANVLWQGDVCNQVLRCIRLASAPATILNLTGPEMFSIRQVALRFGALFGKKVTFVGEENGLGYLSDATKAAGLLGYPTVPLGRIIEWTGHWVRSGGQSLDKPTHFETQDGTY